MADPHHVAELTGFDRLTVRLYRTGLTLAAVGLGATTAALAHEGSPGPGPFVVWAGVALATQNVHVYDPRFGWAFQTLAALGTAGLLGGALADVGLLGHAGLGFLFAAHSGLGLKERLCFRVPGMRAMPGLLAAALVPLVLDQPLVAAGLLGAAALPATALAVLKLRQPLHYDIGDKTKYR